MSNYLETQTIHANSLADEDGRPFSKDLQKYYLGLVVYSFLSDNVKMPIDPIAPNLLSTVLEAEGYKFVNGLWYNKKDSPYSGGLR